MHPQPSAAELADAVMNQRSLAWQSAFVDRFWARGYTLGMLARLAGPDPGLEPLLTDFSVSPVEGKR
jgi:hypothetical protein